MALLALLSASATAQSLCQALPYSALLGLAGNQDASNVCANATRTTTVTATTMATVWARQRFSSYAVSQVKVAQASADTTTVTIAK